MKSEPKQARSSFDSTTAPDRLTADHFESGFPRQLKSIEARWGRAPSEFEVEHSTCPRAPYTSRWSERSPCVRVTQLQIKYAEPNGTPFEKYTGKKSSENSKSSRNHPPPCERWDPLAGRARRSSSAQIFSRVWKAWRAGESALPAQALYYSASTATVAAECDLPGVRSPSGASVGFGRATDTCRKRYIETEAWRSCCIASLQRQSIPVARMLHWDPVWSAS